MFKKKRYLSNENKKCLKDLFHAIIGHGGQRGGFGASGSGGFSPSIAPAITLLLTQANQGQQQNDPGQQYGPPQQQHHQNNPGPQYGPPQQDHHHQLSAPHTQIVQK